MKRASLLLIATACQLSVFSMEYADTATSQTDSVATAESRPGLIKRIINYFANANKRPDDGGFDFSVIGGPHYSSDSKLGI